MSPNGVEMAVFFFRKNCKNCPTAGRFTSRPPHMSSCSKYEKRSKYHTNGIEMQLVSEKNCKNCPAVGGFATTPPYMSKTFKMSSKWLFLFYFFLKKLKNCPVAGGFATRPPSGSMFSHTQSSQPTTFKAVITEFLNKQML